MNPHPLEHLNDGAVALLRSVLESRGMDPTAMIRLWHQEIDQGGVKGLLAVAKFSGDHFFAIINLPVLVMPMDGVRLSLGELLTLTSYLEDIPGGQYAVQNDVLCFTYFAEVPPVKNNQINVFFATLLNSVKEIQRDAMEAFFTFYGDQVPTRENRETKVKLPKIRVTPADGLVIYKVLAGCPVNVQKLFTFLMEKWADGGYIVTTTPTAVVLDAPYGSQTTRLAILMAGLKWNESAFYYGKAEPASLILTWNSLRKQPGFSVKAVDRYQDTISKLGPLHVTESTARLENVEQIDLPSARILVGAMLDLVKGIRKPEVKESTGSNLVTPANIQKTLDACDSSTQKIFGQLMDTWRMAGGTVLCGAPGRIHLKMKTHGHQSENFSHRGSNFDLVVLAAPKGARPAHIKLTLDLASSISAAYLDTIPDEVMEYGVQVLALPGFEQKGTITRLVLNGSFQEEHALRLAEAMVRLKQAEANA